jgi:hypothetical protein
LGTATGEEDRAGDVAVSSGLKRVEDVEEKVVLLPSGSDDNGEWWPTMLNGEQRRWQCGTARKGKCERQSSAQPRACFIGGKNLVGDSKPRRWPRSEAGILGAVETALTSRPHPI